MVPGDRHTPGLRPRETWVRQTRGVDAADAGLDGFNRQPEPDAEAALLECLGVPRWAGAVAAGRPYGSREALLAAAREAAEGLTDAELDAALARHPRIGERPGGDGREAGWSRSEQGGVDAGDPVLAAALRAGNLEYERRFGHVFLIRAAGRSGQEMLRELNGRLLNDAAAERDVVRRELTDIALLRLAKVLDAWAPGTTVSTHVLDSTTGRPATGVGIRLERRDGDGWRPVGAGATDDDGRLRTLAPDGVPPGTYRLTFATGEWFATAGRETFYPEVTVTFTVAAGAAEPPHLHVPLLLAPFAYSTYRGS